MAVSRSAATTNRLTFDSQDMNLSASWLGCPASPLEAEGSSHIVRTTLLVRVTSTSTALHDSIKPGARPYAYRCAHKDAYQLLAGPHSLVLMLLLHVRGTKLYATAAPVTAAALWHTCLPWQRLRPPALLVTALLLRHTGGAYLLTVHTPLCKPLHGMQRWNTPVYQTYLSRRWKWQHFCNQRSRHSRCT